MTQLATCVLLTIAGIVTVASAQDPAAPIEYVASVKRTTTGTGGQIRFRPGNIEVTGVPIRLLIRQAFGQLQDFQIVGGPAWMNADRFDLVVKIEGASAGPQVVPNVLRQVLEDRFTLKTHRDTRELPIFALVLARNDGRLGPNLTRSSEECAALMANGGRGRTGPSPDGRGGPPLDARGPVRGAGPPPSPFDGPMICGQRGGGFGRIRAGGASMPQLAAVLSGSAGRVVIDKTGLSGYYDMSLIYTPAPEQLPQGPAPPGFEPPPIDPNGPSLFTAIQEQLGLRLQDQRGPVEVVVIDSVEPPTEN